MTEAKTKTEKTEEKPERLIRSRGRVDVPSAGDRYQDTTLKMPELDIELFGPTAFFVDPVKDGDGRGETQMFEIMLERLKGLSFDGNPGRSLQKQKKLRVMKAIKPDGTIIQLPMEDQINNAVVGTPGAQIGLLPATQKGYHLLQDKDQYPYFCYAIDCWAAAMRKNLKKRFPQHMDAVGTGFCTLRHADHILPNRRGAGIFGEAATTARIYNG